MTEFHLNKTHKFFYFQTRINRPNPVSKTLSPALFWNKTLQMIEDLNYRDEADIFGLVWDEDVLKIIFSTPYFNENILMLEWELKLKNEFEVSFERPITCEPISGPGELKQYLLEIYRHQIDIENGKIRWRSPYNSLKLILDGHRYAYLFKDPFRVVFQPQIVFQIGQLTKNKANWGN
jgi:hypothetical protein